MAKPKILDPFPSLETVEFGENCTIVWPVNLYRCKIGNNVRIGPFVEIQENCEIGDDTVIQSHSFIAAGTKIGARVFIGHGVITCNDRYPRANNKNWKCEPISIGDDAVIGSGAIILPGAKVGMLAMVGAGSVVKEAPAATLVVGCPATEVEPKHLKGSGTIDLPKSEHLFFREDPYPYVLVSATIIDGYRHWKRFRIAELPNDLVTQDDLASLGLFTTTNGGHDATIRP